MNILDSKKIDGELTKVELYKATKGDMISIKDVEDDTVINVIGYVEFEDTNKKTGENNQILSLIADDGKIYATQSITFKENFFDMFEMFEEDVEFLPVIKTSGLTKADRPFVNCKLAL